MASLMRSHLGFISYEIQSEIFQLEKLTCGMERYLVGG